MNVAELAELFAAKPLPAVIAVLCITNATTFALLIRELRSTIKSSQLYGSSLTKMETIHSVSTKLQRQTLEQLEQTREILAAVLGDARVVRFIGHLARVSRGSHDDDG